MQMTQILYQKYLGSHKTKLNQARLQRLLGHSHIHPSFKMTIVFKIEMSSNGQNLHCKLNLVLNFTVAAE